MKYHSKYTKFIMVTAVLFFITKATYADSPASICDDPYVPNSHTAQCVYLTGLGKLDHRRWIKLTMYSPSSNITYTTVSCSGSLEQDHDTLITAYYPITQNSTVSGTISICTDSSGSNCKDLKSISLSCQQGGDCSPQTIPIDISLIKYKYPTCNQNNGKNILKITT